MSLPLLALFVVLAVVAGFGAGRAFHNALAASEEEKKTLAGKAKKATRKATRKSLRWLLTRPFRKKEPDAED